MTSRRRLFLNPATVVPLCIVGGVIVSIAFFIRGTLNDLVELVAVEHAECSVDAIEEFRTLYASEVVERVRQSVVSVTHDYEKHKNAIPLPATLSRLLGKRLTNANEGGGMRLCSRYPFPWREGDGGARDDFEREALDFFNHSPNRSFNRVETLDGVLSVRVAHADILRAECVSCLNNHRDSPKTNWKEGDVRGVLAVTIPVSKALSYSKSATKRIWAGVSVLMIASLVACWLIMLHGSRQLRSRNRVLEDSHTEQAALSRILQLALEDRPLNELLRAFLDELLSVSWLDVEDQGAVFLTDGANSLVLTVEHNLDKPLLSICHRVPFGACLCGRAAATARTQFASCVDERHEHRYPGMGPHGHYNVPIVLGERLLGVIVIYLEPGRIRDQREVIFLESAAKIAAGLIVRSVSSAEKLRMQSQLLQSQKLESIGQLAAGIAHEINTPAQYVGDNLEFLDQSFGELVDLLKKYRALQAAAESGSVCPELISEVSEAAASADIEFLEEEIPRSLSQSREGIGRVTKIVRAMKEFSHPGSAEKQPIDLNRAIESTVTVASNEWKYVADLETDFDADLPMVPCLAGEFNQVVLNIVVNAAHALAEGESEDDADSKGLIRIQTRQEGDDWAVIEISDNGPGMPEAVRAKIFDPFFTTKEVGKGTGQGLAIAHSVVVDKHAGTIEVESEVGQGTTFCIRLPLAERQQSEGRT